MVRTNMQAQISIRNLGPVSECNLNLDDFTVLTGRQASGKSTIAKCVYFCRTIKDDILTDALKQKTLFNTVAHNNTAKDPVRRVRSVIREKFLQLFGTSLAMSQDMSIDYFYSDSTWIKVRLSSIKDSDFITPKFVRIEFSSDIIELIRQVDNSPYSKVEIQSKLNDLFQDEYNTVFIPAGRSLISLLTTQLNYIFMTMDDEQKKALDYCTQKYVEYILKIRPSFNHGARGLIEISDNHSKAVRMAQNYMERVLCGEYIYNDIEERLYFRDRRGDRRYVKMNYTSSGQQESVWIFNILFYILVNRSKAFIIVEEPEAHLYPDAQKDISEMLALMLNNDCQLLVTTHSPYVLGAFNNLIYAKYLTSKDNLALKINDKVDKNIQISNYNAYFVENGEIVSCLEDGSEKLIKNEVIDGASKEINQLYEELFEIHNDLVEG